jgi:Rieske Fe-S protein
MRATDPTMPVAKVPLTLTDKPDWQSVVLEFAVEDGWARARPEPHLAYVRRDGETVKALSSVCPHMGCQVIWAVFKQVFDCPCHGAQFDATGKRIAGPTEKALLSLPCEVDGDIIRVSLPGRDEAVAS